MYVLESINCEKFDTFSKLFNSKSNIVNISSPVRQYQECLRH